MNSGFNPVARTWMQIGDTSPTKQIASELAWIILSLALVLSPIGDFLSVHAASAVDVHADDARASLLVRSAMVSGLLGALIWGGRTRASGVRLSLAAAWVVSATLGSCALGVLTEGEALAQVVFALKVFSFFVYLATMSFLSDRRLLQIESVVFFTLMIYGVAIIVGAVFSIDMFRSYQAETQIRSGYKGIVYAQNEAAALVVVSLGFGYLQALVRGWNVRNVMLVACMLVAALLTGTKGAALGALGMTCVFFYARYRAIKATIYLVTMVGIMVACALTAYLSVPSIRQAVDLSINYFADQGSRVVGDKMITLLLSGRNLKFANVWNDLQRHDFVAFLTGGHPVVRYMVEIDIPDLLLMFGLPAFAIYFMALAGAFVRGGSGTKTRRFGRLFFFVLVAMAATAGHVLGSAVTSPFLALIAVTILRDHRNRKVGCDV